MERPAAFATILLSTLSTLISGYSDSTAEKPSPRPPNSVSDDLVSHHDVSMHFLAQVNVAEGDLLLAHPTCGPARLERAYMQRGLDLVI